MTSDLPVAEIVYALSALLGLGMIALAALRGWDRWLAFRRHELDLAGPADVASRIELADLRERLRRLEAIAAGVDP
ncbi:MAG: hypothetical protein ACK4G2_02625 [Novosphingobium sp.]